MWASAICGLANGYWVNVNFNPITNPNFNPNPNPQSLTLTPVGQSAGA